MERNNTKVVRFWILIVVLLAGGVFINWFERRGEAIVERRPLSDFPVKLGQWAQVGSEIRFDKATESVLKTSEYTMREYAQPDGRIANLYVGYYASQRTGTTYHSPQNCLPGAGWVMREPELVTITTTSGRTFTANRFIVENGDYNEVMLYWYQGRGRVEASEYNDKINTVWDSVWRRRTDGAMVRLMTNVGNSQPDALRSAVDLAAETAESLSAFVPD